MRFFASLFAVFFLAVSGLQAAYAGEAFTRAETLSQDLAGPSVMWVGSIAESWRDGGDTCFRLSRLASENGYLERSERMFIACPFGFYDAAAFPVGRELRVSGNLGGDLPRLIGGQVYALPFVAGASVELLPLRVHYYGRSRHGFDPYPCGHPFSHHRPYGYRCW
jgi:starvation-inducible outer membrane lipoprotein